MRSWKNRRTLVGAGLLLCGAVLILLAILAALWVVMPDWFRQIVIQRIPSLQLAYLAAERQAPDGDLSSTLYDRFSRESILHICADRFENGSSAERAFAARHVNWSFWVRRGEPRLKLKDPVLQQRLVHGLFQVVKEPNYFAQDAACAALLSIDKSHLSEVLKSFGKKTPLGFLLAHELRGITDQPEVTTFLIENFRANPGPNNHSLHTLLFQRGQTAELFLASVLSSYGHASHHRFLLTYIVGAHWLSSPQIVAAIRVRCTDNNNDIRRAAIDVLAGTDNGLEAVLQLRMDPSTTKAHMMADSYLQSRGDELTVDQQQRLKNAPPLADHETE